MDCNVDRLLNVSEAAEFLGCTERMVRKLTSERRLAVVKVGRLTRFSPRDLEVYVRSQRREAVAFDKPSF